MAQDLLVDNRIEEGQKLITELARSGFDVTIAFWLRTTEDNLWFLYVGSTSLDSNKIGDAYRVLYTCLRRIPAVSLSISEVKLVHPSNPIARDAMAVRDRHRARIPTTFKGERLGNVLIEEASIYPALGQPMSSSEILQTITALMQRRGNLQPSTVTFRDGKVFQALPLGVQVQPPGHIQVVFHDTQAGGNVTVSIDDVVNIQ